MKRPAPKIQQRLGTSNHARLPSWALAAANRRAAGSIPDGPIKPSDWAQIDANATAWDAARKRTKRRVPVANDASLGMSMRTMMAKYYVLVAE